MEPIIEQLLHLQILNQLWLAFVLLIPIVLISRSVVAGTRYSPILIIVIFGLAMGFLMVQSKVSTPGLSEFPLIILLSKVTVIVLIVSFFVGGQELQKIIFKNHLEIEQLVVESQDEIILGTKRTQFVFILRSVFILLGIAGASKLILGHAANDPLGDFYSILTYIGLIGSVILIDSRATIKNKPAYIRKGVLETIFILLILVASFYIAKWIKPYIALPQIFFAMIISASLGFIFSRWHFGPTIRSMLFAGIPVVLAANFLIGGSRILEALKLMEMKAVMGYGFFGQIFWMFGGLALLILFGKANHVRNLAPGMAGSLSHSGLTGACTAGDLGQEAAARAPIMINVPFFGHIFVFSILAYSAKQGELAPIWTGLVAIIGIVLTTLSLIYLGKANGDEPKEVKGLMLFCFGWQICAVFCSFLSLYFSGMSLSNSGMATSSALSHFGLFAATQGGMFGQQASDLIPFIFAMPFLVHPLVFGIFGKAMSYEGKMPEKIVYPLALIGLIGVIVFLFII
ncbi:MAG: hypothetical protein MJB14_09275 [Spirochaetes bacterium]|nr:hypothetical protein [Spirochaetota bacterium]